ncbi:MAG: siroheme synthase [Dehalococcoidia bacterium]|nr:siroheme synthase [Dehalococcoidia bacterium]
MAPYYPAFLDVKDRSCVIIGGGEVAERKIASLLECGARVRVISPEATEAVQRIAGAGSLRWEKREYREGDLEGAFLAIAATDDTSVNRVIAREAQRSRVLLNVVDVTSLCTFIAPAVVRRGDVVVAISTSGLSPALARKLREELEKSTALEYADIATLVSQVRQELRQEGARVDSDHWQACLNEDVLALYRSDKSAARERLKESLLQGAL